MTEPAAAYSLSSDAAPARLTAEQLKRWSALYGKGTRQIRRWIDAGVTAKDPCPLDHPALMPEWWTRRMTWRCPDSILRAAAESRAAAQNTSRPETAAPAPGRADPAPAPYTSPANPSINLASYDLEEGAAVANQRRLVAALYAQLEHAYLHGGDSDLVQSKYNKAVEALRRLEKDDREDRRQNGSLIPVAAVQGDLLTLAQLMRQYLSPAKRRLRERIHGLNPSQLIELDSATDELVEGLVRLFRTLPSLKSPADVALLLAA